MIKHARIGGQVTLAPVVRTTKKTINNTYEKKERTSTKQLATGMNLACHVRRPRQSMLPPQPSAPTISCRQLKTVMINEAEVVVPLRQFSLLCRDLNFCSSLHPSRINPKRWFASTIHIGLAFNNAAPYVSQNMGLKDTGRTLLAASNTSIESDTASKFVSSERR